MDAFRHLNNGAAGRYFEEARAAVNMQVFGSASLTAPSPDEQLLLVRLQLQFLRQAYYPGTVQIGTAVQRIGTSSWTCVHAAFQDGQRFATCESVMVKARRGKSAALDPNERAALERLIPPS
jgi:acyl-CoA thioester hydrolase